MLNFLIFFLHNKNKKVVVFNIHKIIFLKIKFYIIQKWNLNKFSHFLNRINILISKFNFIFLKIFYFKFIYFLSLFKIRYKIKNLKKKKRKFSLNSSHISNIKSKEHFESISIKISLYSIFFFFIKFVIFKFLKLINFRNLKFNLKFIKKLIY